MHESYTLISISRSSDRLVCTEVVIAREGRDRFGSAFAAPAGKPAAEDLI
jgi:hypothetical protein